jgi:hypothetical protein
MKFNLLFLVAAVAASAVERASAPGPSDFYVVEADDDASTVAARAALALAELQDLPLEKRACVENGCKCASGYKQGQYCGSCGWEPFRDNVNNDWMIRAKRVKTHVFECSKTGACCSYGYAKDCGTNTGIGRCGPYAKA